MGKTPSALGPKVIVPAGEKENEDVASPPAPEGWWDRYVASLKRLSSQALEVLEEDARLIADHAFPTDQITQVRVAGDVPLGGAVDEDGAEKEDAAIDAEAGPIARTGMVVGSVQSGKTSSMLGVAAIALDRGVNMVVLLAGTRVGLWLQTYERLLAQLDGSTAEDAYRRRKARLILPQPADVLNESRADPGRYLNWPLTRQALKAGRPIICVVPKEDDHLRSLSRFLLDVLPNEELDHREGPFTMLLLDDEADDASVLDSASSQKVTPRLIASLWSGDEDETTPRHEMLQPSYVAYTATPQANYLQATHNPLAPRNFHAALRTPGPRGTLHPRSLTYTEPLGLEHYYCGGEMFYEHLKGLSQSALCQPHPFPTLLQGETEEEFLARNEALRWSMLGDGLRSFLVSAAIRLLQEPSRRYDRGLSLAGPRMAMEASPHPHTMLVHPSARKEDHFSTAADIVRWSMAMPGQEAQAIVDGEEFGQADLRLSISGLSARLRMEEQEWRAWLRHFEQSRIALSTFPGLNVPAISINDWPAITELLEDQVFPHVELRVLNSDPASADRPRFSPSPTLDGFGMAPDILSIFVAGNVLSRGLTLEGLTTSLFLRGAAEPAADTQMQMQRWFGYRGRHLPFCRVLCFDDQLELFAQYHVNDNALKQRIMLQMEHSEVNDEDERTILILEGTSFVATSKVESRKIPLSPGPKPSIRLVEASDPTLGKHNLDLVGDLLDEGHWVDLKDDNDLLRGRIREETLSLGQLADILDQLRYVHHDPDPALELSKRWSHYQGVLGVEKQLFRPPGLKPGPYRCEPQSCPYTIAAYLRLWEELRGDRHAHGFYPTDRPDVPWSLSDAAHQPGPRFYLAVRNGSHVPLDKRLADHRIKAMTRQLLPRGGMLRTLWGTRGYQGTYYGDENVDYYHHRSSPLPSIQGEASWRPRGHPGLALIHVIQEASSPTDLVAIGLALPHGGPDHIAALRP